MGTITGIHTGKTGVVWVRFLKNPKLYEVERHLIFGTAEAAEAQLHKGRKGKSPTTNTMAPNEAHEPPN